MPKRQDLTGQRFGRWTVESFNRSGKNYISYWNCICDCGSKVLVLGTNLTSERSQSCGCLNKEIATIVNTTHGLTYSKLFNVYRQMIRRCTNPKDISYPNYGERGIKVCDRWLESFDNFYNDIGKDWKEGLQLDRINNNGNYELDNCRWVSHKENQQNKRHHNKIQFSDSDIQTMRRLYMEEGESIAFIAKKFGCSTIVIRNRLDMSTPIKPPKPKVVEVEKPKPKRRIVGVNI